jgi:mannose-6-phosphate isomerase-like protein (cupin superfamily)
MHSEIRKTEESGEFLTDEGCYILEVANDEGDPDVSIARARVPVGGSTEWHRLARTAERYVLISGRGRVEIEGLEPTEVGPGHVVRIPAETAQRIVNIGSEDLVFYCVCTPRFRPECYQSLAKIVRTDD